MKHIFVLLAVTLAVFYSSCSFADELGRLFTTPEERRILEELRNESSSQTGNMEAIVEETGEGKGENGHIPDTVTVNGLVYRKNNNSTAWIESGNNTKDNTGKQQLRIRAGSIGTETVQVELPSKPAGVKLKVGETYITSSDKVEDIIGTTDSK